jgi:hypothetical protein
MKHIIVTTPKSEIETSAQEAAECLENGGGYYFRKLGRNCPKELEIGSKVYYVEDGYIRGFGVVASVVNEEHICGCTDRNWGEGWYAIIPACSWMWIRPIKMTGFQGFRYFDDSKVEIVGDWKDKKPQV